eukprot:g9951.t1 g9951   contig4:935170-935577(-)
MGASVSKRESKDVVCVDCDKKTQKDLPSDKQLSSACDGMPCELLYKAVVDCMDENNGQIAPCVTEWDAFKECHSRHLRQ